MSVANGAVARAGVWRGGGLRAALCATASLLLAGGGVLVPAPGGEDVAQAVERPTADRSGSSSAGLDGGTLARGSAGLLDSAFVSATGVNAVPGPYELRSFGIAEPATPLSVALSRHMNAGPERLSQRDSRWSDVEIGDWTMEESSCVPVAMTAALNGYGIDADPLEMARLMHETGDFNRDEIGAGAASVVVAAEHYGTVLSPLHSKEAVEEALLANRTVLAMLRGPKQITTQDHAVAISQLVDGETLMMDPWTGDLDWWSLDTLWKWETHDPLTRAGGAPAFWAVG